MTYKVLITDILSPQGIAILEENENIEFDVVTGLTSEQLARKIVGYDGLIVRSSVKVTKEVLEAADKLKVVGRAGVGIDNINTSVASLLGIIVMNTPGANTMATTEHTFALMLALCRHIPQAYASLKDGRWDRKKFMGWQLYRKTIGIIGVGRIGTQVAKRCQAFNMETIAYDPYLSDDIANELKIERVDLPDLLKRSDFITLHAASTPNTKNIIDAKAIAQMKDGVSIINAARGALVDEAALVEGLKSGKIKGAALDVFADEPLSPDSELLKLDNIIFTPHLAASTKEAQRDVGTQIIEQMIDALSGVDFRNAINMPVVDANLLNSLGPFLNLAEKVGSLQTQLADDAIERIEIEIKGDEIVEHIKPITVALLKGILEPVLTTVNYINAPHIAQQRGIVVSQINGLTTPDYPNLISCRVEWTSGSRTVAATLFNHDEPRIVQIDNYMMDVRPEGNILVTRSHDRPGFIGQVGAILGENDINIAAWRYGRTKLFGMAISFIGVDTVVPEEVINLLLEVESIDKVQQVKL